MYHNRGIGAERISTNTTATLRQAKNSHSQKTVKFLSTPTLNDMVEASVN